MIGWKDSYSVGVKAFDDAHHKLFDYFDQFYTALRDGNSQQKVGEILNKTLSYTKQHFESEERWLAAKNDPDLAQHIEQHRKFQSHIEGLIRDHSGGKIALSGSVSKALREWLTGHIMEVDQKYGKRYNGIGTAA